MGIVFLLLFVFHGVLGEAGPPVPLSFLDAVDRMEAHNPSLSAAEEEIRQKEEDLKAAQGLRYPKGELEVRQTFLDSPIEISIDPIPFSYGVQEKQFTKGQVKLSFPVYTGGRISAANEVSKHRKTEADAQKEWTRSQLITELAQRYYGLVMAQQNYCVQKLKRELMEQHVDHAERLFREGIIAKVELLHAQVELANTKQEEASAQRDITIVLEGLNNLLFENNNWEPNSGLFMLNNDPELETFKASLDETHPAILIISSKVEQAYAGVKAEKGATRPTVYLFGLHELFKDDLTILDPTWAVGIGLNYTLFDGFQGKHKTAAAKALAREAEFMRAKIKKDLESLVIKRYEEMKKAREQWESFDTTLELTKENLRVRTKAFEEGVSTSLEVVDAVYQHSRAQLGRLKSTYDYDVALFQLLEAGGQSSKWQDYTNQIQLVEATGAELSAQE